MNLFERASRANLTLTSTRGPVSFNDLWNMPLTARDGFSLDGVAKAANRELKTFEEESFVEKATSTGRSTAELRLEIVKHVIASKIADRDAAQTRAANAEKRARLLEVLDKKQDEALASMSEDELREQLASLDA